jgi:arginyl-tRNA synthetase
VTPELLALAIRTALVDAVAAGELAVDVPGEVRIERTRNRDHGDWSTNVALQIAKSAGMPPRQVASTLAARLGSVSGVKTVDIAGPGFLNITLDAAAAGELARTIVEAGPAYGRGDAEAGHRINVEFVSANPTGPIHLGSTRWAAVGDALARIFEFSGAASTTSTTTALRSTVSRRRFWLQPRAIRPLRMAMPVPTSMTSLPPLWRGSRASWTCPIRRRSNASARWAST